ncbi:uncharacterized protein LOC122089955 [Macadamia integrifolia]|uniref:uncharacterized protein LOC122089955 n=1 Tax=Macadamia integrifolia TaxID=60698 RepID=UPI001C5003B4|nr:uncharacterized protein LOC122089955 [Macadamia integrifolia]
MPLPWKKSHSGRVSRLVADLRSSRKHGGSSLVVETGFPTSLIDLIVKNRDRLKKKKKNKNGVAASEEWEPIAFPSSPICSSVSSSPSSSPSTGLVASAPIGKEILPLPPISSSLTASSDSSSDLVSWSPSTGPVVSASQIDNSNRPPFGVEIPPLVANLATDVASRGTVRCVGAFTLIVMGLFMVILGFATEKLAVGITISTFLLLFLELVAVRAFYFHKPCPDLQKSFNNFAERVLLFFVRRRREPITENLSSLTETEPLHFDFDSLSSERRWGINLVDDYRSYNEEEQLEEPGFDLINRRWSSETEIHLLERRWRPEIGFDLSERRSISASINIDKARAKDISSGENGEAQSFEIQIVQSTNLGTHKTMNGRLKSKKLFKKLVPKKFRSHKKAFDRKNKLESSEEEAKCEQGDPEDELKPEELNSSDDVSQVDTNGDLVEEYGGSTEDTYGFIIMVLIVLSGLVQGRFMAIMLTMIWYLLVKSVQTAKRI